MAFSATLMIQGVSVFVPDRREDPSELTVLFPSQQRAMRRGLAGLERDLCDHHAVLQFSGQDLGPSQPDLWTTIGITGLLVEVSTDTATTADYVDADGHIRGVPDLAALLEKTQIGAGLRADAIPGSGSFDPGLLSAALRACKGVLSPDHAYKGQYRFYSRDELDERRAAAGRPGRRWPPSRLFDSAEKRFSSVLKLEFGEVSSFALRFSPLSAAGSAEPQVLAFTPRFDHVEVWVRHFCELSRPSPGQGHAGPGESDDDYLLNYALLRQFESLTAEQLRSLPIPVVSPSWEGGEPLGGKPNNCAGAGGSP